MNMQLHVRLGMETMYLFKSTKLSKETDHVYLRHLSTECRSILSADMATNTRPICRPSVGRVSVDMNRQACRPTPGRYFSATRPILHRHSAATRPILYQHSANTKLTWSALANVSSIFPALLREAFSGRRPFLALNSGNIHVFFQLCLFLVIVFIYDPRYFRM